MSVVIQGQNDSRNTTFLVEMKPNYTDESANHPLACKVIFCEDIVWGNVVASPEKQSMQMSFPEFYSYLNLLIQNDQVSEFYFRIPGFPELQVDQDVIQDISAQDQISECLEVFKSMKYTLV